MYTSPKGRLIPETAPTEIGLKVLDILLKKLDKNWEPS